MLILIVKSNKLNLVLLLLEKECHENKCIFQFLLQVCLTRVANQYYWIFSVSNTMERNLHVSSRVVVDHRPLWSKLGLLDIDDGDSQLHLRRYEVQHPIGKAETAESSSWNRLNFWSFQNSLLSALPYFTLWVLSFLFSACADYLINHKVTSIGVTRKLLNSIGETTWRT